MDLRLVLFLLLLATLLRSVSPLITSLCPAVSVVWLVCGLRALVLSLQQ